MPKSWQILPDDVLEEEQRRLEAGDWAMRQRQVQSAGRLCLR